MLSTETMTEVATIGQLSASNAFHFGGETAGGGGSKVSTTTLKRKTPSELRGELLKRKKSVELVDESPPVPHCSRNADGAVSGIKKSGTAKASRSTRMDEHFPVTRSSGLLSRKENPKETFPSKRVGSLKNYPKHQVQNLCTSDTVASETGNGSSNPSSSSAEVINNTFKSVRELSLGGEKFNGSISTDMGKALKGLVSLEPCASSATLAESIHKTRNIVPQSFCSEFHIPDYKIPLDLTLKTNMRLLSLSSVNWLHRLMNCDTLKGMDLFSRGCQSQHMTCAREPTSTSQITNPGTFHSWVHPQSTLPHAAISALTTLPGGQMDFLSRRQQAWEDSFRSLYYMLRRKVCKLFYVCCVQFVVMFAAPDGPNKTKSSCYAYLSQSTSNLRHLLKEHGVSFSMPLCCSKVEEVTADDLAELSEIKKYNLGQTRAMESMAGVDSTPQSLLMFTGNRNIHALYDFLLNYRSFLTTLTGVDLPVLYSPVPFKNAALSTPEVRCKQVRRVEYMSSQLKDSNMDTEARSLSSGICYSVEINDAYLPPWIICGICDTMRSNGAEFQASFVTEPTSIGLNVGLDTTMDQPSELLKTGDPLPESDRSFGIPNATLSLQRRSAFLKGLKYSGGSYTAFLSPVD